MKQLNKVFNWKSCFALTGLVIAPLAISHAAPPVEDDLKYAIGEFASVTVARPAKLLQNPLVQLAFASGDLRELEDAIERLREEFGVDVTKIERVTVFGAIPANPLQGQFGFVAHLSEPFDEQPLRGLFEQVERQGKTIWRPKKEGLFGYFHVANPKKIVGAWTFSEQTLHKMLAESTTKSALLDQLQTTSLNHDYAQVTLLEPARKMIGDLFKAQALRGVRPSPEEAALQSVAMAVLQEANALEVAIDFDSLRLLTINIDAAGPDAATRLEGSVGMAAHLGAIWLRTFLQSTVERSKEDAVLAEIAALLDDLLRGISVAREGQRVSIAVVAPKDFAKRSKYLAEFVKRLTIDKRYANNMRELTIALQNYHDVFNEIVPSAVVDTNGKPLYSWRVQLLPFLEHAELYEQFHKDEPWDSEHNKQFLAKMPDVFRGSANLPEGKTNLLAIVNKEGGANPPFANTALRPSLPWDRDLDTPIRSKMTFGSVIDGLSNTAWLVQMPAEKAAPWTKPDDFVVDPETLRGSMLGLKENDWFLVSRLDASIAKIKKAVDKDALKYFFHCNDRRAFTLEEGKPQPAGVPAIPGAAPR